MQPKLNPLHYTGNNFQPGDIFTNKPLRSTVRSLVKEYLRSQRGAGGERAQWKCYSLMIFLFVLIYSFQITARHLIDAKRLLLFLRGTPKKQSTWWFSFELFYIFYFQINCNDDPPWTELGCWRHVVWQRQERRAVSRVTINASIKVVK